MPQATNFNFAFGHSDNLISLISYKLYAHGHLGSHSLEPFGLLVIFLRAQPCFL